MPQGRCLLPADEAGRVLDRLLLLEQVIGPEGVRQALADTACFDSRACKLTREVIFWVVLAMGVFTELPIRGVFKAARRLRAGEATPHRSSLCLARQRLGVAPVRRLFQRTVRPLATPQTPGAFYHQWRLMALDGTVESVPDSPANAAAFGYPEGGARGPGARPQIRKLSLVECSTHAEIALQVKGIKQAGEQSMAPALLRYLDATMLLLWDRGFFSYSLWKKAIATGGQVLARVQSRLVLRPQTHLDDGSYLAQLYPCESERNRDRNGLVVRVIRYRLDDRQRTGHGEEHVLITTLLDAQRCPALELVCLYHERWEIELVFDEQKTHQDPRRATKPAHLRSETPLGVLQEVYAMSLGHYAVRAMMAQAAATEQLDPDRLSFTGCFQILKLRLPECIAATPEDLQAWYEVVLWEMSWARTDDAVRRNRINPRVVRQKMSKFKKKRPEHRGLPPLQKRFIETVVMIR
jgi:hypothetical protein